MPWMQDPTCCKQRDSSFPCAVGQGEGNGFWCSDGNVEEPLDPHDGGASPHPGVPRDADKRTARRLLGEWCALHPAFILVLAVLVVVILALAVALAVQSAGRHGSDPDLPAAPVLACPEFWVGYRNVCYYLSREEGSWEWSQEQCSLHGASLAVLRREWEMEFLSRLKGNADCWLGLRRRGERVEWVDGSSFNNTFPVHGQGACMYLNDYDVASSSCSQQRPYICSKPQALM
ncbi:C-type lectin domain family 2 member B-like [Gymnogyps californianus]|uniref:C-type lectin domain family 2 member B-like n=1 Tax=Gymnogyps californianus TaxID=33616 RepID=UPI0021C5DED4|nr:C-type lectin domain family 2 member B-like [Gymnogyps californianus]